MLVLWFRQLPKLFLGPKVLRQLALKLGKRPFVRNVAAVASGAAASQAITVVFAPLITRLYGPEVYGILGVFLTIAGIMAPIAAMSYPIAIVLPKSNVDALGVAKLSMYVGMAITLLVTAALFLLGTEILDLLNAGAISYYIYLVPVFMLITVLSDVASQWSIRMKAFTLIAKVSVIQALITNAIKAGLGFVYPTAATLIITNIFGGLLSAVLMLFGLRRMEKTAQTSMNIAESKSTAWELAYRHRDFALFRTPQNLLNTASHGLPVVMLTSFFGLASVGYYAIASAVLTIPAILIGNSVMQVFYPRVTEAIHVGENVKELIIKATFGLAASGALPFVGVILAGPLLFEFVFGEAWQKAGVYAQWLSVWLFFQYINKPAVSAIPALGLQRGLLTYEIFSTGAKVLALYVGYAVFGSDVAAIALFSIFGVAAYAWLIFWVISHSAKLPARTANI